MDLNKAIKERHSVRRFSTKKVDWRDIIEAINCARLAPLAGNIPTIKFILVSDKEKIAELSQASQQGFVSQAEYVVVVCSNPEQITRSYDKRAKKYASQQAGAAIENLLLKLTDLGLATCWVGAFVDDQIKSALRIPDDVEIEALFPIGYEMPPKGKQKIKPDLNNLMFFDSWGNKRMNGVAKPYVD